MPRKRTNYTPEEKVAALAGHESLETTRRYVEPSLKDLEKAVELIGEREG